MNIGQREQSDRPAPVTIDPLPREVMAQWHRVRLSLGRLEDIYNGRESWSDEDDLDARSFFVHCYHLADFLEVFTGKDPVDYIKKSEALRLCRDLNINIKHARMSRAAFSPGGKSVGLKHTSTLNVTDDQVSLHTSFRIQTDDDDRDALQVARAAVAEWVSYGLPENSYPPGGASGGNATHVPRH